jgi:hypothetical protein
MRSSRASLISASVALLAFGGAAHAQPAEPAPEVVEEIDLDSLLEAFASMPGLEAQFVEEKQLAMLARPLTSSGTLYFTQPGLLHRRVDDPRPSTVVITPDTLTFSDDSGTEIIDLRSRDEVRLFVESLVWVLAGDRAALDEVYEIDFANAPAGWTLSLTPRSSPLSDIVSSLTIRGEGLAVAEIRVDETAGDLTVTRITSADPARAFDDAEHAELFGDRPQ